jgi:hypothetical protein
MRYCPKCCKEFPDDQRFCTKHLSEKLFDDKVSSVSGSPSKELQERFKEFWEYAEKATSKGSLTPTPLLRVPQNWELWVALRTCTEQKRLEQLVRNLTVMEQREFMEWLDGFMSPEKARLVKSHLSQMPWFDSWDCLKPYHPEAIGINAIILENPHGGAASDIKPLAVMLIPKEIKGDYALLNLKMESAWLKEIREATLSLVSGAGRMLLLLSCCLFGWKQRHSFLRVSLIILRFIVGVILYVLLFAPPQSEDSLRLMLSALVAVTSVLILEAIYSNWREARQTGKWATLLSEHQLVVMPGGGVPGTTLLVDGPSFGIALSLSILWALHREVPVNGESWLWGHFFARLEEKRDEVCFTGGVQNWGRIHNISRLEDKIAAASAHSKIKELIIPAQKHSTSEVRIHRCRHLAQVILNIGRGIRIWRFWGNAALLLILFTYIFALPDIYRVLVGPPKLDLRRTQKLFGPTNKENPEGETRLELEFITDDPNAFFVDLDSQYYCNRRVALEISKSKGIRYAIAPISLVKYSSSGDAAEGEIRVRWSRQLLFRQLPDRVVFAMPLPQ